MRKICISVNKFYSELFEDILLKYMGYFSLRCFEPKIGRYVIIVLNVIVGLWGITHWACNYLYLQ